MIFGFEVSMSMPAIIINIAGTALLVSAQTNLVNALQAALQRAK